MVVGPQGTWHLEFGGNWILNANPGGDEWPACMMGQVTRSDGQVGLGTCWQGSNRPQQNATFQRLNALFRWCPGRTADELQRAPLGKCEPSDQPAPAGDEMAELHAIRWRIQGAMWLLGALARNIPGAMFVTPVPVMAGQGPFEATVPGAFVSDGNGGFILDANQSPFLDVRGLGTAYPKHTALSIFQPTAAREMPAYYRNAWTQAGRTVHWVANSPVEYGSEPLPYVPAKYKGGNPVDTFANVLTTFSALSGGRCDFPEGPMLGRADSGPFPANVNVPGLLDWYMSFFRAGPYRFGDQVCGFSLIQDGALIHKQPENKCYPNMWHFPRTQTGSDHWLDRSGATPLPGGPSLAGMKDFPISARAQLFVNSIPPAGTCGGLVETVGAFGLACFTRDQQRNIPIPTTAPEVRSIQDIARLGKWVELLGLAARLQGSGLYLTKVPDRVIDDFKGKRVGSGTKRGERGATFLKMEAALQEVPSHWIRISTEFQLIAQAIQAAYLDIAGADLAQEDKLREIALQQLRVQKGMAAEFGQFVEGAMKNMVQGSGSAQGGVTAFFQNMAMGMHLEHMQSFSHDELRLLADMADLAKNEKQHAVARALSNLSQTVSPRWAAIQTALGDLRASTAEVLIASEQLEQLTDQARYHAAKGTGEDYVALSGKPEQPVAIPVNTVLRRQANATSIRYERALKDAKALAYMARRAIEQRIGMPLSAITWRVGPLEPPASWVDDVCRTQGVNYKRLRTALPPNAPNRDALEKTADREFADAFVGDYVARLESFVAYYNAAFPSHEADDTAVVSLRHDLLPREMECAGPAPNLLYFSDDLAQSVPPGVEAEGWRRSGCGGGKCLAVLPGFALDAPRSGPFDTPPVPTPGGSTPPVFPGRGVSWLVDVSDTQGGTPSFDPPATLAQDVKLEAGHYVLSWWDQARGADGKLASAAAYAVYVWNPQGVPVVADTPAPFVPAAGATTPSALWSARRVVRFDVPASGAYRIGFAASATGALGSVALAHVQLEKAAPGAAPTDYVPTGASRTTVRGMCPIAASKLRAAFERRCEAGACFYELTRPLAINTESLHDGASPLAGKLARGNHNYRHVTLGVNLVGQGLIDCGGTCQGVGYVEYDLEHNARYAGILDRNGGVRPFDFGIAGIRHGKGLAMERFLSFPLSSVDEGLLRQAGIEKPELRGRPLDGKYRLRVYESPQLRWSRLEDIQIVLQYRYWSPINAGGN
jgi:hypothetical protein